MEHVHDFTVVKASSVEKALIERVVWINARNKVEGGDNIAVIAGNVYGVKYDDKIKENEIGMNYNTRRELGVGVNSGIQVVLIW